MASSRQQRSLVSVGAAYFVASRRLQVATLLLAVLAFGAYNLYLRSGAVGWSMSATSFFVLSGLALGMDLSLGLLSTGERLMLVLFGVLAGYGASLMLMGGGESGGACAAYSRSSLEASMAFSSYTRGVCSGDSALRERSLRRLTSRFHPSVCLSSGCEATCRDAWEAVASFRCDAA